MQIKHKIIINRGKHRKNITLKYGEPKKHNIYKITLQFMIILSIAMFPGCSNGSGGNGEELKNANCTTPAINAEKVKPGKNIKKIADYPNSYFEVTDGVLTKYLGTETIIKLPDDGEITSIGIDLFANCKELKEVVLPESVASIEKGAFSNCENLVSIKLPSQLVSIGDKAFTHCKKMNSVLIPNTVTSIGEEAFSNCRSLNQIMVPESVKSMGRNVFDWCDSVTEVKILNNIIYSGEFSHCNSLSSITIPETVTSIGDGAFYGCENLAQITIPSGVKTIGSMAFGYCFKLTSAKILGTTKLESDVFFSSNLQMMYGLIGSSTHEYAMRSKIPFTVIKQNGSGDD